jgi:hypothetical protein
MSYDVALYFRHETFPIDRWKEVIAAFQPQEHEARQSNYNHNPLAKWTSSHNQGRLWLELRDVRDDRYAKPSSARWQVFISRGGHTPQDVWLQFAVPYHALLLTDNIVFYDLQDDVYIESEHEYLEFIKPKLHKFGLMKMFDLGFLDAHGKPIF